MGFMDKLKGLKNAITGGGATVTIQYAETGTAGQALPVKVTVTSTGGEIKSDGVFVDFHGHEHINIKKKEMEKHIIEDLSHIESHSSKEFKLCGEFVLGANETKVVEGEITIPTGLQPAYTGRYTKNEYAIRGRLEAKGNDPDSGFKPIRIVTT